MTETNLSYAIVFPTREEMDAAIRMIEARRNQDQQAAEYKARQEEKRRAAEMLRRTVVEILGTDFYWDVDTYDDEWKFDTDSVQRLVELAEKGLQYEGLEK